MTTSIKHLPETLWPVEWLHENDLYFIEPEIESWDGTRASVVDHGNLLQFSSYSYLSLMQHPDIDAAAKASIDEWGTGAHGVRLVAGATRDHRLLEQELAEFKSAEDAVVFSSGYACNLGVITAMVGRGDVVIGDKLNHASIVDGCQLSGARFRRFDHNDMDSLEKCLQKSVDARRVLVVVDAVFSMDGDIIDLPAVVELARRYNAWLMVDEAHSLGVLGDRGRGIEEHFDLPADAVDLKMGTLSKTIPAMGGYVAASANIVEVLKHRARAFIFSASLAPPLVAASRAALKVIKEETWRIAKLRENCLTFTHALESKGLNTMGSATPIIPIIIGDNERVWRDARECQKRGLFIQAIPSPVVPQGAERLRCIVMADHTADQLENAAAIIADIVTK